MVEREGVMAGGGVVVRNHAVSRVGVILEGGVARSAGPPGGRSQQEGERGRCQQEGDRGRSQGEGDRGRSQLEGDRGRTQGEGDKGRTQGEGDTGRAQQDEESRLDAEVVSLLAKVSSKGFDDRYGVYVVLVRN
jgi:hypothetical protein